MINTDLKKSDFYYDLPKEFIAQTPLNHRTNSKLLVLDKVTGEIEHKHFYDICDYFENGDCLVINDTKVLPARIFGVKKSGTAVIELLLLKRLDDNRWETLVKPGRRAKEGTEIVFKEGLLEGVITDVYENGNRVIEFKYEGIFEEILDELGEMPLPPYIHEKLEDQDRYQTVFAKHTGSAAAPTAGLHFTDEVFEKLQAKGVKIARLTLHVGLGTFRPVKEDYIKDHEMHTEYYDISEEAADLINDTKKNGGRVVAVGTTSTRTLETVGDENGFVKASSGWTSIFIYPGVKLKVIDRLITNFHLPESTLLMLVSAMAGSENIFKAYEEAKEHNYRFFSFGDAMFIK